MSKNTDEDPQVKLNELESRAKNIEKQIKFANGPWKVALKDQLAALEAKIEKLAVDGDKNEK